MVKSDIRVVHANYSDRKHAKDIVTLLNEYALDPMGGAEALTESTKGNLAVELAKRTDVFSILAYDGDTPVGLANCFESFSTFACKPLVNIHDIVVSKQYRGHGISKRLMQKVENISRDRAYCKITLEVLSGNEPAKAAYRKFGFSDYQLDPETGVALFWQKKLWFGAKCGSQDFLLVFILLEK